jgi:hypothetical protein
MARTALIVNTVPKIHRLARVGRGPFPEALTLLLLLREIRPGARSGARLLSRYGAGASWLLGA